MNDNLGAEDVERRVHDLVQWHQEVIQVGWENSLLLGPRVKSSVLPSHLQHPIRCLRCI
jgi:hypothetical protein